MIKLLKALGRRALYHKEIYIIPPLIVFLCWLGIQLCVYLTGRAVIDNPGAIVGFLYNAIGAAVVVLLTGLTQEHFFGYRSRCPDTEQPDSCTLQDDLYDACVTAFLLIFFAYLLWH